MSHLGNNLSALIDGELSGAELDRASAHLASCDRCRGEAAALRLLKRELRALVEQAGDDDALTTRLLAMAAFSGGQAGQDGHSGPDGPIGPDGGDTLAPLRPRPAFRTYQEVLERGRRSPRHRYLVWGAVSLAVIGGLGAAAFTIGGPSGSGTGPGVVPQVEVFNMEHAIDSGDVPFPDTPSLADTPPRVPERGPKQVVQRWP